MFAAAVEPIRKALQTAGLSAVTDPRNAHPPCALILPRRVSPINACLTEIELEVLLIAPGPANGDALGWLDEALTAAYAALPIRPAAQLVAWTSPHTSTQLLAFSLITRKQIRKETR